MSRSKAWDGRCITVSISIHVINGVYGRAAAAMSVVLSREVSGKLEEQWRDLTDDDGRISGLNRSSLPAGSYAIDLNLDGYFRQLGLVSVNSAMTLRFYLPNEYSHYGVLILVTPAFSALFMEPKER